MNQLKFKPRYKALKSKSHHIGTTLAPPPSKNFTYDAAIKLLNSPGHFESKWYEISCDNIPTIGLSFNAIGGDGWCFLISVAAQLVPITKAIPRKHNNLFMINIIKRIWIKWENLYSTKQFGTQETILLAAKMIIEQKPKYKIE